MSAAHAAPLAWGAKVSPAFRDKVRAIAARQGYAADDLMCCMAWETGRSFRPDVKNMAGSGATGLIQFMPDEALSFFHTVDEVRAMTPGQREAAAVAACEKLAALTGEAQLDWVEKYFAPYVGKLKTLADLYMAILWPRAIGKPPFYVLFDQADRDHPARYRQNAGLDVDRDGKVTKAEASAKVAAMKVEGLRPLNIA